MKPRMNPSCHRRERSGGAGFTLVELMVSLTGGLLVSLAVFALARDSGRFYQRESRIANATVGALLGFERLRTDIARAAFLSSPNATRDIGVCSKPAANWPLALRSLASIQITQPATSSGALAANGRNPPSLLLAGSFSSVDQFPATARTPSGPNVIFDIEKSSSALLRLGNGVLPTDLTMQALFATGRALRFTQQGKQYYGSIVGATGGVSPTVTINSSPPLQMRSGAATSCGVEPIAMGTLNLVQFIQYSVRNLATNAATPQGQTDYASLYANSAAGPGEAQRTELVRVEENVDGTFNNGTEEVVAEYAVDLGFQITAVTGVTGCCDPTVSVVLPSAGTFPTFTGNVFNTANTPELVRTLRVRLGVRSRESDRAADITADVGAGQTQGLYRFNVGSGAEPYARVRTFQADVALANQMDVLW
jgi:hypothetical protein